jgi:uncharacterized protein YifN (PemK superfamily)
LALHNFHPKQGHYLICNFDYGFVLPEIVKPRPVIVISKTDSHGPHKNLCTVVALSTTPPHPKLPWHWMLSFNPNPNRSDTPVWVKGDMIYTVSYYRLDRPHIKTHRLGRTYQNIRIAKPEIEGILNGIAHYFGLGK